MFCSQCGKEADEGTAFCISCGAHLETMKGQIEVYPPMMNQIISDKIGENYVFTLERMVDKEMWHYIPLFGEMERFGRVPGTPLGLIWPFYMLYRKMYKEFFIFAPIALITSIIPGIGVLVRLGLWVYMCINLKKMYYQSILNKLNKYRLTGKDIISSPQDMALVKRIGGVSFVGIIVYFITVFLLGLVSFFIFMTISKTYATRMVSAKSAENKTVFQTKDSAFAFSFEDDWHQIKEDNNQDLKCCSYIKDAAAVAIVYEEDDIPKNGISEDLLDMQVEDLTHKTQDFHVIEDKTVEKKDEKKFTSVCYEGKDDGDTFYYYLTLTEFEDSCDKYVMSIFIVSPGDWDTYKEELKETAQSAKRIV